MKKSFLHTPVGIIHLSISFFIIFNLISGFVNLYISYIPVLAGIHFYTGLLIIAAPLCTLFFMKNRGRVLRSFIHMALPHKNMWQGKKAVISLARITADIIFLTVLCNMVTGILMKVNMLAASTAFTVHTTLFNILLGLVPLHVVLMLIGKSREIKKPV